MRTSTSSISQTTKHLMSKEEKMKKEQKFLSGRNMEKPIRNGRLSILTKLRSFKLQVLIKTSDFMSTDHSI